MNHIARKSLKLSSTVLALVATVSLVSGVASANAHKNDESKNKKSSHQARVVAHIPFSGLSSVDMAFQQSGDQPRYLYVQHAKGQGISIIDIGKPAQAKVVGVIPRPEGSGASTMSVMGNVAVIAGNAVPAAQAGGLDHDVVLWDLSKPATPREVQGFSGVVRWLHDDRDFIYVLNADGLWVIAVPEPGPDQTDVSLYYGG
jgi:hypothetical protein